MTKLKSAACRRGGFCLKLCTKPLQEDDSLHKTHKSICTLQVSCGLDITL